MLEEEQVGDVVADPGLVLNQAKVFSSFQGTEYVVVYAAACVILAALGYVLMAVAVHAASVVG